MQCFRFQFNSKYHKSEVIAPVLWVFLIGAVLLNAVTVFNGVFLFTDRHESVQPPRVDQVSSLSRTLCHSLVPGCPAVRHGVWGHPIRTRRGDHKRAGPLPEENLHR